MRNLLLVVLVLAGCQKNDPLYCGKHPGVCDDGGNFLIDAQALAAIGGNVSGLGTASGLVLQNNGGDDKPVLSDGAFRFPTQIGIGTGYDVTVSVQPTNPSEMCSVTNGSGTATGDVSDVTVTCAPLSYTIGGSIVGLSGSVDLHNGSDTITVSNNGMFSFPTKVQSGQMYTVTATNNAACAVFGGTGTVGNNNVTSVVVNCGSTSGPYVIGGHMTGLNGAVQLTNSDAPETITVNSNGTYAFSIPVASAGAYHVTVTQNPNYPPAKQNCVVANGTGTAGGNVQNIDVTCTTLAFTVGGQISGINGAGTVTLQNNNADNLNVTTDGNFTFATSVLSGGGYSVSVASAPNTRACSVSSSTGTVTTGNVTSVRVSCSYKDPGVKCGGSFCGGGTNDGCCDPETAPTCEAYSSCGSTVFLACDSKADCGSGKSCCIDSHGNSGALAGASCQSSCSYPLLCDPMAGASACPNSATCKADGAWGNYPYCH